VVVKKLRCNLSAVASLLCAAHSPPCNRFVWLINPPALATSSCRGGTPVLAQPWIGRRTVRVFAGTAFGACEIMPTARNSRRHNHHRREQCDQQEDPRGHDPHLFLHPIFLCRLTLKKVHGSVAERKFAQKTPDLRKSHLAVRYQRSAERLLNTLFSNGSVCQPSPAETLTRGPCPLDRQNEARIGMPGASRFGRASGSSFEVRGYWVCHRDDSSVSNRRIFQHDAASLTARV